MKQPVPIPEYKHLSEFTLEQNLKIAAYQMGEVVNLKNDLHVKLCREAAIRHLGLAVQQLKRLGVIS